MFKPSARFLCLITLLGLGGCGYGFNRFQATQEVSKSFTTEASPRVIVDTFNGKGDVIAGPTDRRVEIKVTKRANGPSQDAAEENLEDIKVSIALEGNTVRVKAEKSPEASRSINRGADIELQIPPGSLVDLTTSNGKVSVTGPTA